MNYGNTNVILSNNVTELGEKAASDVAGKMRELLSEKEQINMVFSSAESQLSFFTSLAAEKEIDWKRVVCFNVDDFHDVRMPAYYTCGFLTQNMLYDKVLPKTVNLINYRAKDPYQEAERFSDLLVGAGEIDIMCLGIGESGHLALNEPFDTDFNEKKLVKVVDVAAESKAQLMNDPHFRSLGYIPEIGITMTTTAMQSANNVYTMVPLENKQSVLKRLFQIDEPTNELPASILLKIEGNLYLDKDSCPSELASEF
ncbi:MAG: 6-phosphogluconolactonase [Bacteroidota bacterium]